MTPEEARAVVEYHSAQISLENAFYRLKRSLPDSPGVEYENAYARFHAAELEYQKLILGPAKALILELEELLPNDKDDYPF